MVMNIRKTKSENSDTVQDFEHWTKSQLDQLSRQMGKDRLQGSFGNISQNFSWQFIESYLSYMGWMVKSDLNDNGSKDWESESHRLWSKLGWDLLSKGTKTNKHCLINFITWRSQHLTQKRCKRDILSYDDFQNKELFTSWGNDSVSDNSDIKFTVELDNNVKKVTVQVNNNPKWITRWSISPMIIKF